MGALKQCSSARNHGPTTCEQATNRHVTFPRRRLLSACFVGLVFVFVFVFCTLTGGMNLQEVEYSVRQGGTTEQLNDFLDRSEVCARFYYCCPAGRIGVTLMQSGFSWCWYVPQDLHHRMKYRQEAQQSALLEFANARAVQGISVFVCSLLVAVEVSPSL